MREAQHPPGASARRFPKAVLLREGSLSSEDRTLTELLDFLGIPWEASTAGAMMGTFQTNYSSDFCVLTSAPCLAEAVRDIKDSCDSLPSWMTEARSIYIDGFQETEQCRQLLQFLTSDTLGGIRNLEIQAVMSIASDAPEMCGPMSGLRVVVEPIEGDHKFNVTHHGERFRSFIRANDGEFFFAVTCMGVSFYLSGSNRIIDISSQSAKYFDVRKHFCSAVPAVMYLKWAFADVCWTASETSGCLIVDDPPLKPRYGFMRFREALELMDKHKFTTAIGFIPWNCRRTSPRTVGILQKRPDRFSLCIHGSDHTAGEFASRSAAQLNRSIKTALQRMELLIQSTSLQYVPIMVFPQGAFSPEAGRALKLNGFVAAANTEVAPANGATNQTTIADLWNVAIVKYGTFPIFTRRYLTHGIENFAFDGLLGKPCLIVGHHDVFKSDGRELVDFIAKLNSLKWDLRWRPLGDALSHSFRVRNEADGTGVIQTFAETLAIGNPSAELREWLLFKEESDPDCVKAVMVNQNAVDFSFDGKYLRWRLTLAPNEMANIRIVYFDRLDLSPSEIGLGYKIKVMGRRYLCEFRDNILSQNDFLYEGVTRMMRFLK